MNVGMDNNAVAVATAVANPISSESQEILLLLDAEEDKRLYKLSKLATKYVITICIIIKNHLNTGSANLCLISSSFDWQFRL